MFDLILTSTTEEKLHGTIKAKKEPNELGLFIDINGTKWNIKAIYKHNKKLIVSAVQYNELHPYYSSTMNQSFLFISRQWHLYEMIIEEVK